MQQTLEIDMNSEVTSKELKINGFAGGEARQFAVGEEIDIVTRVRIYATGPEEKKGGNILVQKGRIVQFVEVSGQIAEPFYATARERAQMSKDELSGQTPMFMGGFAGPVEPAPDLSDDTEDFEDGPGE